MIFPRAKPTLVPMPPSPNLKWFRLSWIGWALLLSFLAPQSRAETIILHLKNGDRITGTIISEDTNRVVITNSWTKELSLPLAEIVRREKPAVTVAAPTPAESKAAAASVTNVIPSAAPGTPVAIAAPPPPKPQSPKPKYWKGELKLGADFLYSAKDQHTYYGRFKLLFEHPYSNNPKQFFRNIFDYGLDYGRTEENGSTNNPIVSANRMDGSDKTDFDVGNRIFIYNLGGVGYDKVRKIDLRWEVGPGVGYHLLTRSNLVMNTEIGFNYQAQYRSDDTTTEKFYYRFAEDFTWKLNKTLTFTEKLEYFPQVGDMAEFRLRFEATLSYGFWQRLSLNLGILDLYDSSPASNVPNNDLQLRSSLGISF